MKKIPSIAASTEETSSKDENEESSKLKSYEKDFYEESFGKCKF
ncbi:hypothetical protein [Cytobacillus horneckiae]|nr:hypothetical protein [Cytobacillus horneckiae]MEC1155535.1 hypothetical protein [Cytobacillus horneckiae]MED2936854.1 hypothetical protein [Cytobacillus horneckiae]